MNDIEPEKAICIDHIFIAFPKGITRVFSFSNNLRKRVNEGLQITSDIWARSATSSDADDQTFLAGPQFYGLP